MVYVTRQYARRVRLPEPGTATFITTSPRYLYVLSCVAAALATIVSLGGLLFGARGLYEPDPYLLPQLYGQDAITLVLAVPALLLSMRATRRGSDRALLLWAGLMLYFVYSYYFYVIGVRFNALFLAYAALVSTSAFTLIGLFSRIDPYALRERFRPDTPARPIAGYLIALAALFAVLWIGDVVRTLTSGEELDGVSRLVYVIDLTLVLPAMALAGVWLWQQKAWGYLLAGLLLIKVSALGITLLVNTMIALFWHQEPNAILTAAFALLTLGALAGSAVFLRSIRQPPAPWDVSPYWAYRMN